MEKILEELKKTNDYLEKLSYKKSTGKNPYELLTVEQIVKEYKIRRRKSVKDVSRSSSTSTKIYNTIQGSKKSLR